MRTPPLRAVKTREQQERDVLLFAVVLGLRLFADKPPGAAFDEAEAFLAEAKQRGVEVTLP